MQRSGRPDANLHADSEALHEALAQLVRLYQFRDRDRICCHDVSVTQCHALEALVEGGTLRLNVLAERLFLDKSTASRVIDALERKRYVERLADPHDARAIALRVTPAGRRLYERIRAELIEEQRQILADMSPEARSAAIEVIGRLTRAARRRFAGACAPAAKSGCG